MTIVLTAGGSGGHITPILAVASELKRRNKHIKIIYIGLQDDVLADVADQKSLFDETYFVRAGKFRRYHSAGVKQVFDLKTQYLNVRDFFRLFKGLIQSYKLIKRIKPDLVFSRGGFVIVPVCLAAKLNGVPYITHDSDSIPSLANRIIARWAKLHFVALPKETYHYDQSKTVTTGIPLKGEFVKVTGELKKKYRQKLDISDKAKLLFITGGGLGAVGLNGAMVQIVPHLVREFKDLYVIHLTGRDKEEEVKKLYRDSDSSNVRVIDFTNELYEYSGAADLIVTRAGATNLAEFAIQGKACIVVPSSFLVSGHQLQNAEALQKEGAAEVMIDKQIEEDPNRIAKRISYLFNHPEELKAMEQAIGKFAKPGAAGDIADRLIEIVEKQV